MNMDDERYEKALQYLIHTDHKMARLHGLYKGYEDQTKSIMAQCFMEADGGTAKERDHKAALDPRYIAHMTKLNEARIDYEAVRLKRATASIVVDVWRTLQANKRQG